MKKFKIKFYREQLLEVELYASDDKQALEFFKRAPFNTQYYKLNIVSSVPPTDEVASIEEMKNDKDVTA
jgi:hypothetical protein